MKNLILVTSVVCTILSCSDNIPNSSNSNKIIFTWDVSPFDDRMGSVTETIEDITVTVTAPFSEHTHSVGYFDIIDSDNISDGNVVVSFHPETAITFTFTEPVFVESILALSGNNDEITYTVSVEPKDVVVTQSLRRGTDVSYSTIFLNWDNITSFTVTASNPTLFGFDFLTLIKPTE